MPIEIFLGGLVILSLAAAIIVLLTQDPRTPDQKPVPHKPSGPQKRVKQPR